MEKDNNRAFKTLAIVAICIAVVGLSIGYAALSQTLNITTEATVGSQASNWNIKFVNPGEGQATGTSDVGTITLTSTDVTVSGVILKAPGDAVTYTFDVVNDGTIDAKVSTFTQKTPTVTGSGDAKTADEELVNTNYTYSVTYADGSPIKPDDTLTANETKNLKLTITYGADATSLPINDVVISGLGATLVYVQG